jgi:hypothetical protein
VLVGTGVQVVTAVEGVELEEVEPPELELELLLLDEVEPPEEEEELLLLLDEVEPPEEEELLLLLDEEEPPLLPPLLDEDELELLELLELLPPELLLDELELLDELLLEPPLVPPEPAGSSWAAGKQPTAPKASSPAKQAAAKTLPVPRTIRPEFTLYVMVPSPIARSLAANCSQY